MRIVFTSSFVLLTMICSVAQDKPIDIEQLRAPSAPSATIINIQPNEVVRPKSARDLETAVFTNYIGEGNSFNIPNNLMLEVTPYWLGNRKNINIINEYLNSRPGNLMWQNLAISVSSTQSYKILDTVNTNALGFGARTLLVRGKHFDEFNPLLNQAVFSQQLMDFEVGLLTAIDIVKDSGISENRKFFVLVVKEFRKLENIWWENLNKQSRNEFEKIIELLNTEITGTYTNKADFENILKSKLQPLRLKQFQALREKYQSFKNNREGLQVEIASAVALSFPTNVFNFSAVPKWGVWLTGSYNLNSGSVEKQNKSEQPKKLEGKSIQSDLILMIRYIRNDINYMNKYQISPETIYQNNYDLGMRVLFNANKYSLGLEAISSYRSTLLEESLDEDGIRTSKEKVDWEWKYMLNFNYAISPNLVINYNIGKSIEPSIGINGNIISNVGLNFGFGGPKLNVPTVE